jgi:hypothetical protein
MAFMPSSEAWTLLVRMIQRRAGRQRGKSAGQPSGVVGMQPVDILGGIDGVNDGFGMQRFRQRQLHENAVHRRIAIELANQRQ